MADIIKIKALEKQLHTIDNICEPLEKLSKFQSCLSADAKLLVDISQSITVINSLKTLVKDIIDKDYTDIVEQPDSLKKSMCKTYDNMDNMANSYMELMKEIVVKLERQKENVHCCSAIARHPEIIIPIELPNLMVLPFSDPRLPK